MSATGPCNEPAAPTSSGAHRGDATAGQDAAQAALSENAVELRVPVLGRVTVPVDHLVWYAAVVCLAAVDVLDWPVAGIVIVGKMLSDNHRSHVLEDFGRALDELAA
jgi:hypothetical protein